MAVSANAQNEPVKNVDTIRYAGSWYSLSSIPTFLDKKWRETIENYTLNDKGYYDVVTTYKKAGDEKMHSIKSRLFPDDASKSGEMNAQFLWPFKVGYRIIELGTEHPKNDLILSAGDAAKKALKESYSYTVVGHPKKKYLFIMSRYPYMNKSLYEAIVQRCKVRGYDVSKLVLQGHKPGITEKSGSF